MWNYFEENGLLNTENCENNDKLSTQKFKYINGYKFSGYYKQQE